MPILPTGTFTFLIPTEDLAKGLRPNVENPRNSKYLTECNGAVGIDNVLQVLKDMNLDHLIDVSALTFAFPYPQLFVFTDMMLVCTETEVYEYVHSSPGTLTLKITVAPGILWSAVDFYDYIYMSNCTAAVVRHAEDGSWEEITSLPSARAMCNYNGQIVISPCTEPIAPSEEAPEEEPEEPEVFPPLINEHYWQQSLDVTLDGIVFSAVAKDTAAYSLPVYEGDIVDHDITWHFRMEPSAVGLAYPGPLRMTPNGDLNTLLLYTGGGEPAGDLTIFGYNGSLFSNTLFPSLDAYDNSGWEEFDLHSSGLAVVLFSDINTGYHIRVSTDYGETWGAAIPIDYLYTAITSDPFNEYTWYGNVAKGMSVCVDDSNGTFYLLCMYTIDTDTWENVWGVYKSTNGINWDLVVEWGYYTYPFYNMPVSLAASEGHIYAAFADYDDSNTYDIMYSDDGGANWSESTITDSDIDNSLFSSTIKLVAHGDIVIAYVFLNAGATDAAILLRSTNGGATWTQVLRFDIPNDSPSVAFMGYPTMQSNGSTFAVAFCDIRYPLDGASWTDSELHDMSGLDIPYLCFWLSKDNGETWTLEISPFPA